MEARMDTLKRVKDKISTHSCPECTGPAYCAMEAGKSSNLCWCMSVDKSYNADVQYTQCLCRACLVRE